MTTKRSEKNIRVISNTPGNKRYPKKVNGVTNLTRSINPPYFGGMPFIYKDTDWNIDGVWYSNNGIDTNSTLDPFGDGSLHRRWIFDGDGTEVVTNTPASYRNGVKYKFVTGLFGRQALYVPYHPNKTNELIYLGEVPATPTGDRTTCAWVKLDKLRSDDYTIPWMLSLDNSGLTDKLAGFIATALNGNPTVTAINSIGTDPGAKVEFTKAVDSGVERFLEDDDIENIWLHVAIMTTRDTITVSVNNYRLDTVSHVSGMNNINGVMVVMSNRPIYNGGFTIQQLEIYNRVLTPLELQQVANQQMLDVVTHDGKETSAGVFNPPPFTYLEEYDGIVELEVGSTGNIINKRTVRPEGRLPKDANLVHSENGELLDTYGDNPLGGMLRRIVQNTSTTLVETTTAGVLFPFNTFDFSFDTTKYSYIVELTAGVYKGTDPAGTSGAALNIKIGGNSKVTSGGIGLGAVNANYDIKSIRTDLITNGLNGLLQVTGNISSYSPADGIVVSNRLIGQTAPTAIDDLEARTDDNKSTITIYEFYKGGS